MSYDPRCHDLAELFLSDEPALKHRAAELAQHIQTAVEDWIEQERVSPEWREFYRREHPSTGELRELIRHFDPETQ